MFYREFIKLCSVRFVVYLEFDPYIEVGEHKKKNRTE